MCQAVGEGLKRVERASPVSLRPLGGGCGEHRAMGSPAASNTPLPPADEAKDAPVRTRLGCSRPHITWPPGCRPALLCHPHK